jgi:hypothetical protein
VGRGRRAAPASWVSVLVAQLGGAERGHALARLWWPGPGGVSFHEAQDAGHPQNGSCRRLLPIRTVCVYSVPVAAAPRAVDLCGAIGMSLRGGVQRTTGHTIGIGVSIRTGKGGMSAGRGPGQGEVRKMAGYAPTCSTCGAVLSGYGRSEELNFQVHFCPQCRAREEAARTRVEKQAVQTEVIPKAA